MLNSRSSSKCLKHLAIKTSLAFLAFALLMTLSCGKRKPPLPPVTRVSQRVEANAFQRGDQVILSWKMPARNAPAGDVTRIVRADIYRLAEPLDAPLTLSEEEFAARSVLIGSKQLTDNDFGLRTVSYFDQLEIADQPVRLRYSVRLVNESGQRATFSNFVMLSPSGNVAGAPTSLSAVVSQESVRLEWTAPADNINGTRPANIIGYNIYRADVKDGPAKLLNKTPVSNTQFQDEFFAFEKEQQYFVRAVSIGSNGDPAESRESNIVAVTPVDTFAPDPPASITLAATQNSISIFFAANVEKDIAGYRIYRSTDANTPQANWELLTPNLLTTNTFRDDNVQPGVRYFYYITAVDKKGNVSVPSETVSEMIR